MLATDPLQDLPVAFALVSSNDHDHMRRFLKNLKNWGVEVEVVVTDGSGLYPALLAELWPQARHQLCLFHVLKDLHKEVFDALRRMRRKTGSAGLPGTQAQTGSASQNPSKTPMSEQHGEISLPLQAPLFDREAAGADESPGAT